MPNEKLAKEQFFALGINYKKANADLRGLFNLNNNGKVNLLTSFRENGIEAFVISTCNRTEVFGFANNPDTLIQLLCQHTKGTLEEFTPSSFVFEGEEAFNHMFRIASGLGSQILGDFEIISQIKNDYQLAKDMGLTNACIDRLVNSAIHTSKVIKNKTSLSDGAASASYAAVNYIKKNVPNFNTKNILLFGTGDIGKNTCENLIKHSDNKSITLINRTREKAEVLATKYDVDIKPFEQLEQQLEQTDILIVGTNSNQPTITTENIPDGKEMLILDLSMPRNTDKNLESLSNIKVLLLDHLSKMADETLEKRKSQIPLAEAIIEQHKAEFMKWIEMRKFAPVISALKEKLTDIQQGEIDYQTKKIDGFNSDHAHIVSSRVIQKITTLFANHLKGNSMTTQTSIDLVKDVFSIDAASADII